MRMQAAFLVVLAFACKPKQPLQPSYFTQTKPANAPLDCKETIDCYAACQPIVEECLLRCDDRSSYYVVQRSRAVSNCVAQAGCKDPDCDRERCGAEIDACTQPARARPMQPPPMGPPMEPPPPPPSGEPMPPQPVPRQ